MRIGKAATIPGVLRGFPMHHVVPLKSATVRDASRRRPESLHARHSGQCGHFSTKMWQNRGTPWQKTPSMVRMAFPSTTYHSPRPVYLPTQSRPREDRRAPPGKTVAPTPRPPAPPKFLIPNSKSLILRPPSQFPIPNSQFPIPNSQSLQSPSPPSYSTFFP